MKKGRDAISELLGNLPMSFSSVNSVDAHPINEKVKLFLSSRTGYYLYTWNPRMISLKFLKFQTSPFVCIPQKLFTDLFNDKISEIVFLQVHNCKAILVAITGTIRFVSMKDKDFAQTIILQQIDSATFKISYDCFRFMNEY